MKLKINTMRFKFLNLTWLLFMVNSIIVLGQGSFKFPLKASFENSMEYSEMKKEVYQSKKLSDMENLEGWKSEGFGNILLTDEKSYQGRKSILLKSPTKGKSSTDGRPWGNAGAVYNLNRVDLSAWNRISFMVYPDLPGFNVVSLSMVLYNEGEIKVPNMHNTNGQNFQVIENGKWNRIHWYIGHLNRDKVTKIEIRYRLQGNERSASDTVRYYLDDLCLEKVDNVHYKGWDIEEGQISYNHLGYFLGQSKIAVTSNISSKDFLIVDVKTNRIILKKLIKREVTPIGAFQVMDFSELNKTGKYILKAGKLETKPFTVETFSSLYKNTIVKTLNLFYSERCGYEVPGIHSVCHSDWRTINGDRSIIINGGWHDAGDLSQALVGTAESVYAILELLERIPYDDKKLRESMKDEATWGLDWILKTRFGNGYRATWSVMDFWTDGIIGTNDDVPSKAVNDAHFNFLAAKTEAKASQIFNGDIAKSNYLLSMAEEDWSFGLQGIDKLDINIAGSGLTSSLILYEVTKKQKYMDAAFMFSNFIINCQQKNKIGDIQGVPISGFFYEDTSKTNIVHFQERVYEHEPIIGLVEMCKKFPKSKKMIEWQSAIQLYCNFYKTIAKVTYPYQMIPGGIYNINETWNKEEKEEIHNGISLGNGFYLRLFPVRGSGRGNNPTILSKALGLITAGKYLNDKEIINIGASQLNWVLGLNPFNQSLMYGVGYRFISQYSIFSGNIVGGIPVGVQTYFNKDVPFWSPECSYTSKEVFTFCSSRWLSILSRLIL